jgi:hypothetical protein
MDHLKKRIDELLEAANRVRPPKSDEPPAAPPRQMTAEEWDDFISGKPMAFKVRNLSETAYYVTETVDGRWSLTRLGTNESDLTEVAEKKGKWTRPEHAFNPFCTHWNGSLKTRPGSTEVLNSNQGDDL